MQHNAVLIPGDGIGPEVAEAVVKVMEAAKAPINWVEKQAGLAALKNDGDSTLPDETIDSIIKHGVALKGPCTTPIGGGFSSINVALRKRLNLYGAVRPVRSLEGVPTRYENVDVVIIRENTEGLYSGIENVITKGVVTSLKVATAEACERIARFAFNYAVTRGRKKITTFHKANIMKLSDGMFIRCARKVHEEDYPDFDYGEQIIDAGCMKMVQDPTQFDIILCENLYGDVMSDLCAGLVGGLGVTPGANFGKDLAVFEAVHGSAPDIAGKNLANPLALLMSGVMMLNYIAESRDDKSAKAAAGRIRDAYNACLLVGEKTQDLGGTLGTNEFADALINKI